MDKRVKKLYTQVGKVLVDFSGTSWEIEIEKSPDFLQPLIPNDSLIIANDGAGDYLFLPPLGKKVWIYYKGDKPEAYCLIDDLFKQPNKPSETGNIYYSKDHRVVKLGDQVEVRSFIFLKSKGVVTYLPGVSVMDPKIEFNGLVRVGMKLQDGGDAICSVENGILDKDVKLILRKT